MRRLRSILERPLAAHVQWLLHVATAYLGLVYFLALSRTSSGARTFLHAAVAIATVLTILQLARFLTEAPAGRGSARWIRRATGMVALSLLAMATAVFVDYAVARWSWAESGRLGEIGALKERVFLALLACNTVLLPWRGRHAGQGRALLSLDVTAAYLALIAAPLASYYILNRAVFSNRDVLVYLALFMGMPIVAVAVATAAARVLPRWWGPAVCGLFFTHYSLPMLHGALKVSAGTFALPHLLAAVLIPLFLFALATLERRLFVVLSLAYLVLNSSGAYLMGHRLASPLGGGVTVSAATSAPPEPRDFLRGDIKRQPDILLLVYDGYPNERLFDAYRIDNAAHMAFLRSAGFRVYPDTYSQAFSTLGSMTRVLDMTAAPRAGIAGRNAVNAFLKHAGYETFLVLHPYFIQHDHAPYADHVFPPAEQASQLTTIVKGIAGGEFKAETVFATFSHERWLSAKRDVLARITGPPRFLYAHSGHPGHSQNSGACLPDERARFAAQLAIANREMTDDIELILQSRRDAIVIVASDHGPFLTSDCLYLADRTTDQVSALDLADRYGTLLAVRWPPNDPYAYEPPVLLQDIFFAVFAYLLDTRSVLEHRPPRRTFGYGPTLVDSLVVDGRITAGRDRGKPLFSF